jgi:hypothetical protein
MNLEKRVTEGRFFYIRRIDHDSAGGRLIIEFIKAPEELSPAARTLTFTGIEDFSEEVDGEEIAEAEAEGGMIDSLIGLDEYPEKVAVKYVVYTEVREMIFRTKETPRVEDVQ